MAKLITLHITTTITETVLVNLDTVNTARQLLTSGGQKNGSQISFNFLAKDGFASSVRMQENLSDILKLVPE